VQTNDKRRNQVRWAQRRYRERHAQRLRQANEARGILLRQRRDPDDLKRLAKLIAGLLDLDKTTERQLGKVLTKKNLGTLG
jgi:hypothetical protein